MKAKFAPVALAIAGLASLIAAAPALAHHSFSGEFDQQKPVKLQGTVTRMEWINPHSWIHLAVKGPNGEAAEWMIEVGTPNLMLRRGFTTKSLAAGTEIIVEGYLARDGSNKANGGSITFTDGRKLFVGGPGAEQGSPEAKP
jgi:hypothetical protein